MGGTPPSTSRAESAPGRGRRARPPEANTVVAYDASWPQLFDSLHSILAPLLAGLGATIEHVGSTAVPGLAAKPIVDIDVVVATGADVPAVIARLATIGYEHCGDLGIAGREAFHGPAELPYHHLYVVVTGSRPHEDHVLLRDHLRRRPEAARRYGERKLAVAHLITPESRVAYLDAKADLVEQLLLQARAELRS